MRVLAMLLSLSMLGPGCDQPPDERATPRPPVDAGGVTAALVASAALAADAGPDREPVDLAPGRWKLGYQDLCVEIFPDHTIEVAVDGPRDRDPVRIGGRYRAVPGESDTFAVTIESPRLLQKQLTRCRKS